MSGGRQRTREEDLLVCDAINRIKLGCVRRAQEAGPPRSREHLLVRDAINRIKPGRKRLESVSG
jgi:hypothetical protein